MYLGLEYFDTVCIFQSFYVIYFFSANFCTGVFSSSFKLVLNTFSLLHIFLMRLTPFRSRGNSKGGNEGTIHMQPREGLKGQEFNLQIFHFQLCNPAAFPAAQFPTRFFDEKNTFLKKKTTKYFVIMTVALEFILCIGYVSIQV